MIIVYYRIRYNFSSFLTPSIQFQLCYYLYSRQHYYFYFLFFNDLTPVSVQRFNTCNNGLTPEKISAMFLTKDENRINPPPPLKRQPLIDIE